MEEEEEENGVKEEKEEEEENEEACLGHQLLFKPMLMLKEANIVWQSASY